MYQTNKDRYYSIFKYAPVSLWEENFSEIKRYFDSLRSRGVTDFRKYFKKYPQEVISLAGKVKIIDVNETTLRIYQARDINEFRKGLSLIFNKESYEVFREELTDLSEGKKEFCAEAVNLTFKGEERHILLKLTVPPGYEESLSKVVVSIIDISDLKYNEKRTAESVEKYQQIFKNSCEAMFLADTETGIVLETNKKAEELFGMPASSIVGMHYTQFYPKEEAERHRRDFQRHLEGGNMISGNVFVCNRSGEKIPISINSNIIDLNGGKIVLCILREAVSEEQAWADTFKFSSSGQDLTKREYEILQLIASGLTNRQTAEKLHISCKTVETHRTRIMQKLGIHKTAGLVRYAMSSRLL